MRFTAGELVKLTWLDIRTDLSTSGRPEPVVAHSMGRVEESNRWWIRLATSWYDDPDFPEKDTICIPRGCITKKAEVEE